MKQNPVSHNIKCSRKRDQYIKEVLQEKENGTLNQKKTLIPLQKQSATILVPFFTLQSIMEMESDALPADKENMETHEIPRLFE